MGGADRGGEVDFVNFARGAGLSKFGGLSCGLESAVCAKSADRVTGVDCVDGGDIVEWTDRVESFVGVNGDVYFGRRIPQRPENTGAEAQNNGRSGDACCPKKRQGKRNWAERRYVDGLDELEACRTSATAISRALFRSCTKR